MTRVPRGMDAAASRTVRGTVTSVTSPRVFVARSSIKGKKTESDYYHVFIDVTGVDVGGDGLVPVASVLESMVSSWSRDRRRVAKVYFPVVSNVSDRGRSPYDKKSFTSVLDPKTGRWIAYRVSNPALLVGKHVEVTGDVVKGDECDFYINRVTSFKIRD